MAERKRTDRSASLHPHGKNPVKPESYRPALVRRARSLDPSAADDLVSKTLEVAYRKLSEFQKAREPGAWLLSVLQKQYLNHRKKKGRIVRRESAFAGEAEQHYSPSQSSGHALEEALHDIPRHDRAALWLREAGYTHGEIGEVLGESRHRASHRVRAAGVAALERVLSRDGERQAELGAARIQRELHTRQQGYGPLYGQHHGRVVAQLQRALEQHLIDLNARVIRPAERLGWSSAALYTVDSTLTVLEAVAATNPASAGVIRHRLPTTDAEPEGLNYDIEVDTYVMMKAERLGQGFDPRYNRYVFHSHNHARFVDRLFIVLVLVRDPKDNSIHQDRLRWIRDGATWVASAPGYHLQPIGTLSVSSETLVDDRVVLDTLRFAGEEVAVSAYLASMQGLCEQVLASLVNVAGAIAGSLHVCHETSSLFRGKRTSLSFREGGVFYRSPNSGGLGAIPREKGLGQQALSRCAPVQLGPSELQDSNVELAAAGYACTTAYPLMGAEGRGVGLLYLHHAKPTPVDPTVVDLVRLASHELDAALRAERRSFLREHVFSEVARFTQNIQGTPEHRLEAMAQFAWNLLGCDHVSVVLGAGDDSEGERVARHAGRHLTDTSSDRPDAVPDRAAPAQSPPAAPESTLHSELCRMHVPEQPVFLDTEVAGSEFARGTFALRENINATAVVPLRWRERTLGLMVIDYRGSQHDFSSEKELICGLASFFAAGVVAMGGDATQVIQEGCRLQRHRFELSPAAAPLTIEVPSQLPEAQRSKSR